MTPPTTNSSEVRSLPHRRPRPLGAAVLTLVAIAGASSLWGGWQRGDAALPTRSGTTARFSVELSGVSAGIAQSVKGGTMVADVVSTKDPASKFIAKQLGPLRVEPIVIEFGLDMHPSWYKWIEESLASGAPSNLTRDGSILTLDYAGAIRQRMDFMRAWISEVSFPALDVASREPLRFRVTLVPEQTRLSRGSGTYAAAPGDTLRRRSVLASSFRFRVDGIDVPLGRVKRVEPLTVKFPVMQESHGELRDYEASQGLAEIMPLVVTVPQAYSEGLARWFDDFVIKGNNGQDREKGGAIEWISSDTKTVLGTLELFNTGIFRLAPPDTGQAGNLQASLYCERIAFKVVDPRAAAR